MPYFSDQLEPKFINPLTDFGFKKIFGQEANKDILIEFLNDILPFGKTITSLKFGRSEKEGHNELDRKAIFDLYCTTDDGSRLIVELQKAHQDFFKDRSVYYSSFPIQEQAKRGRDWNFELDAVYTVGILDFVFDDHKDDPEFFHLVELKNQRNEVFYDKLKYIYIELPKFLKTEAELETDFDKWLYLFKHLQSLQMRPESLSDEVFQKVFQVAEVAKLSREERAAYEQSIKVFRDLTNTITSAERKGADETRKEIALKMIKSGLSNEEVARYAGLSLEEVRRLTVE